MELHNKNKTIKTAGSSAAFSWKHNSKKGTGRKHQTSGIPKANVENSDTERSSKSGSNIKPEESRRNGKGPFRLEATSDMRNGL